MLPRLHRCFRKSRVCCCFERRCQRRNLSDQLNVTSGLSSAVPSAALVITFYLDAFSSCPLSRRSGSHMVMSILYFEIRVYMVRINIDQTFRTTLVSLRTAYSTFPGISSISSMHLLRSSTVCAHIHGMYARSLCHSDPVSLHFSTQIFSTPRATRLIE